MGNRWDTLPDLEAVRIFVAVAEHASFRRAAAILRVPRSTVSRRVTELESALKTRLLQRTTRHVTLTEAGDAFLKQVAPALGVIDDAGRSVVAAQAKPRGLVRLTATHTADDLVGGILLQLVARYAELRLQLEFTDRQVDMIAEGFDVAIRTGALADSSLVSRPLGSGRSGYYASPGYLKKHPAPRVPRDLASHECIVFTGNSRGPRWSFQGKRRRPEHVMVTSRIVTNSLRLAHRAARDGFGITWLPEHLVRPDVKAQRLVPVLEDHWPPSIPLQLVYPSARHLAPQVRAAVELLTEKLRAEYGG